MSESSHNNVDFVFWKDVLTIIFKSRDEWQPQAIKSSVEALLINPNVSCKNEVVEGQILVAMDMLLQASLTLKDGQNAASSMDVHMPLQMALHRSLFRVAERIIDFVQKTLNVAENECECQIL